MIACLDQQQHHLAGGGGADSGDSGEPSFSSSAADGDDALLRAVDLQLSPDPSLAARDFGGIVRSLPAAVIRPASADDVAAAVRLAARSARLTVAARGNGHSVAGQATAAGGLVLEMRALPPRLELVASAGGGEFFADVSGGALWEDVLIWGVRRHGLAPASWTDYLGLTVGGTLSNGGISGQAFRWGPQVANVAELEVVTGHGERVVCSAAASPDLFFAALGGLGQFGVITRARIPLLPAPVAVKWIRVVYAEFEEYAGDAEWLVSRPESESFDYLEGFAFVNSVEDPVNGWATVPIPLGAPLDSGRVPARLGPVLYCLEVALHYYSDDDDDAVNERAMEMLRPLRYIRGLEFSAKVDYVEFLSRVKMAEEVARANGTWDGPHPWLNLLVGAKDIGDFDRHVFKRILRAGIGGPMLVYPMLRSKWDPRMSVATPQSEVFYLVALLRFARPFPAGPPAEELAAQNREIVECCRSNGYDFKLYLPSYPTEAEWARHFGRDWPRFRDRKARYDPLALLAPGQRIFPRRPPPPPLL